MTAVEWLIEHLLDNGVGIHKKVRETALELEQIQKMELLNGSKGSDELSKVAENTSFDTSSQTEEEGFGGWLKRNYFTPTSSQTEISDEEIEKEANNLFAGDLMWSERIAFKVAIKWYREQLKKK